MNDNARKWVEALRSGKYEQATGRLRKGDAFCCLGVACDIAEMHGVPVEVAVDGDRFTYDGLFGMLPMVVRGWLGLGGAMGGFTNAEGDQDYLTDRNDRGATFAEIADLIESEPEGLFAKGVAA